jgi:competence protein ComEC
VRLSVKPAHGAAVGTLRRGQGAASIRRCGRCARAATDFSRDLYFQRSARPASCSAPSRRSIRRCRGGAWLAYAIIVNGIRDAIDARIRAAVPGDAGAIASALITGKRDAISGPVNDAM